MAMRKVYDCDDCEAKDIVPIEIKVSRDYGIESWTYTYYLCPKCAAQWLQMYVGAQQGEHWRITEGLVRNLSGDFTCA
jgi:hypothetical protein